jgi:hypothetical protein
MTNNPDALDDLITAVARRMTAAEPPADLSARVLMQLRPRRAVFLSWWLTTAAVLAAGLAFVVVRESGRPETIAPPTPLSTVARTDAGGPHDAANAAAHTVAGAAARRATRRVSRISDAELAWHARAVPELIASDPIAIAPIQPSALAIPLLEVAPITAEPLRGSTVNVNRER